MKKITKLILAALPILPAIALAHGDGHPHTHGLADSFWQGLVHPFTGIDHLAAMLAVGVWSALAFPRLQAAWRVPVAFVALLVTGAITGFVGLRVPGVEPMIAASVLALGLLVAVQSKMPWVAAAVLVGGFAFFHGAAHGYELAGNTGMAALGALTGMALGSAILHIIGMGLGHGLMQRHQWLARLGGLGTALLGTFLLIRLA
jgi:urease accessory protein